MSNEPHILTRCPCGHVYLTATETPTRITVDTPTNGIMARDEFAATLATAAKAKRRGMPPLLSDEVVAAAREAITNGASIAQCARYLGVAYQTLYKRIGSGVAQLGRRVSHETLSEEQARTLIESELRATAPTGVTVVVAPPPPTAPRDYGEARATEVLNGPAETLTTERREQILASWLRRTTGRHGLRTHDDHVYWRVAFETDASRATTVRVLRDEVIRRCGAPDEMHTPEETAAQLGISLGAVLRAIADPEAPAADADDVRNRTTDGIER